MGNFGDCVSLLTDCLSTARITAFEWACRTMEIYRDYEAMYTLLKYIQDNESGNFPVASQEALSDKISFYALFMPVDS